MNAFDLVNEKLRDLLKERFGTPTLPQKEAIPKILSGKNVLLMAPTGFGKTEAALIPLFDIWMREAPKPISILYITPLKALNRDMLKRILWWSKKIGIGVSVRHGDTTNYERKMQSENPDDLMITTPEQIQAMLIGKNLRKHLSNLKYIVIDEIHELLDNKRGVQLAIAIQRLNEIADFKIIALSATIGNTESAKLIFSDRKFEVIDCTKERKKSIIVELPKKEKIDEILSEKLFISIDAASRLRRLNEIIKESKSSLVFTNTREMAEILSSRLRILDKEMKQDIHHSSLSKEVRIKVEEEFKKENLRSIICTSSLQLGIDIGSIDTVIQYQSPREVSQFLQRIGRSGHGISKIPRGVIISSDGDDIFESAVIARKALNNELEKIRTYQNATDILAHQIIGILLNEYETEIEKIFNTIKKVYPYRNLGKDEFDNLIKFMEKIKLIWINGNKIKRSRKAIKYYFENLSSIPNYSSYKIIDITTNVPVGNLDESFISEHGERGSSFIVKGRPWKIVSIENSKVFVEPSNEIESAIPAWEGELIPVPFDVAMEVGKVRRLISEGKENIIAEEYPIDNNSLKKMVHTIKKQSKFDIPTDKKIVIEKYDKYTILHSCFGSKVNETLNRYISSLLSLEYGRPVISKSDPYRIIFKNVSEDDLKKILYGDPDSIEFVLRKTLENTNLFKWRFLQIAKRFGVLDKNAKLEKIRIEKIVSLYRDSPLYEETLNEIFTEKLDIDKTKEVLSMIKEGMIKFSTVDGLSPLGEIGLRYELHDIAKPNRPEEQILKLFKKRIENTKLRLICVNCGKYSVTKYVKDIEKYPRCPKCGSKLIGIVHPIRTEAKNIIQKRLKGSPLTPSELKFLETIKRSADLVIVYGKKAAVVLAGKGIGPQTASRILARMHTNEKELYRDILNAERQYIQTKRFWKE